EMPDTIQLVSLSPESISVTLEKVVEKVFPVEIKTLGTPQEAYTMMDTVITPSQITVSGPADYIQQVATVFVNADVSGLSASYNQNLTVEVLDAAGGNISAWFTITPATCNVVIPIVYSQPDKNVAISPRLLGKPALGYQVSRVVVEPATVKVLGSLEHLNQLYYIETVAININDLKESISRTVSLNPPNNISLTTETVTVAIQIEPVATATFAKDLIYIEHLSTEFSATLGESTVNITVAGPNTDIQKLTTADVIPYVDCHSITAPGEYTLPVKTTLPANINMVGANPAEVNVTIINTTTPPQNDETKNEVI
ncbi:MAG: CdaR family protein, partial [Clostridiales bacterium]